FRSRRAEEPDLNQRFGYAPSLPLVGIDDAGHIFTVDAAVEENMSEEQLRLLVEAVEPDLAIGPRHDAGAEVGGTHEPFHEIDLVKTDVEEEAGELQERFLGKVASAVEIVAALQIASRQMALVCRDIAGEASGYRPQAASVQCITQHCMRKK